VDSQSGLTVPLFNPRVQIWNDHFNWSALDPTVIEGKTPVGRATITRLQMNSSTMLSVRRLLIEVGIPIGPVER